MFLISNSIYANLEASLLYVLQFYCSLIVHYKTMSLRNGRYREREEHIEQSVLNFNLFLFLFCDLYITDLVIIDVLNRISMFS